MIIINNSMPKSGSTLMQYYLLEMLSLFWPENIKMSIEMVKDKAMSGLGEGLFIEQIRLKDYLWIRDIEKKCGVVYIKSHILNFNILKSFMDAGTLVISSYRDPRDFILSARDHKNRAIDLGGKKIPFSGFSDIHIATEAAGRWLSLIEALYRESGAKVINYTHLIREPENTLLKMSEFLRLSLETAGAKKIIADEAVNRMVGKNQFNVGVDLRWKSEMHEEEILFVENQLGELMAKLSFENKREG